MALGYAWAVATSIRRSLPVWAKLMRFAAALVAVVALIGATWIEGATTHDGAFVWRCGVLMSCLVLLSYGMAKVPAHRSWAALVFTWPCLGAATLWLTLLVMLAGSAAWHPLSHWGSILQGMARLAAGGAIFVAALWLTLHHIHGQRPGHPPGRTVSRWVVAPILVLAVPHAAWAIWQRLSADNPIRGTGGFFSAIDLGALLAPALLLALAWPWLTSETSNAPKSDQASRSGRGHSRASSSLWLDRFARYWPWLWRVVLVVLALGLWSAGSRAALLGAGAGVAVLGVRMAWRQRRWMLALLVVGAVGVATASAAWERWQGGDDPYAYSRQGIWEGTAQVLHDHPAGVGMGGYGPSMRQQGVRVSGLVRYPRHPEHPHSSLLNLVVALGWPAALWLLALGAGLWRAYRTLAANTTRTPVDPDGFSPLDVHLALLVAFALPAAVSDTLLVPPVLGLLAGWLGVLAAQTATATLDGRSAAFCDTATNPQAGGGTDAPQTVTALAWAGLVLTLAACPALAVGASLPGLLGTRALTQAQVALEHGEFSVCESWARRARQLMPWSESAVLMHARGSHAMHEDARRTARTLLAETSNFVDGSRLLARAAWLLEQGMATLPQDAAGKATRAAWLQDIVRVRRAWAMRSPKNAVNLTKLGAAELALGLDGEAKETFDRAIRVEPNCANALALRGRVAWREDDPQTYAILRKRAQSSTLFAATATGYEREVLELTVRLDEPQSASLSK